MKFLIVGHVVHKLAGNKIYAYGPYVREMNIWARHVDEIGILAPFTDNMEPDAIDIPFEHQNIRRFPVSEFNTTSAKDALKTVISLPGILLQALKAMRNADHIHLRCPGNMGLIGAFAQVFFPAKVKTAKYAGNWDKEAYRPKSYQIQQRILGNTSLSKNMSVLVYGQWPNESKNIKPFFTASYSVKDIMDTKPRIIKEGKELRLLFVGTLDEGKQPNISIEVCKKLREKGLNARLDLFGEGALKESLIESVNDYGLNDFVTLRGNKTAEEVKKAYQRSHFLIFISKSEGWPKAVAEAMFWACLPVTTRVSCVPQMLGEGERGELVSDDVDSVLEKLLKLIATPQVYQQKAEKAMAWSRQYTLEKFDSEIKKLLESAA